MRTYDFHRVNERLLEDRNAFEHAIASGNGIVDLLLEQEQLQTLQGPSG